jgi:Isocitrate/isopropylmalate dehydrogenase
MCRAFGANVRRFENEVPKMQFAEEKLIPATLIAGDGIGPEIVEATITVLDALNAPFAWETHKVGMSGLEAFGDPLPQTTLDSIQRTRLALKGPLTTPVGGGDWEWPLRLTSAWTRLFSRQCTARRRILRVKGLPIRPEMLFANMRSLFLPIFGS